MYVEPAPVPRLAPPASAALPPLGLQEGLPADVAAWSALAEASGNVFATPEWALAWWEQLGRGRRLLTASACGADGRPVALALLALSSRYGLRTARFAGHGPADELGPVCDRAGRTAFAARLGVALRAADAADVLVGEQLPADVDWAGALGGRVVDRVGSPLVRLDGGDWERFLATRSRNLRRQVRRDEQRLFREQGATVRLAADPERFDADWDAFVRLHRERFGAGSGFLAGRRAAAFHRAFARTALERGWLRLWLLELRGRPEAAWYGFRFGGNELFYQAGRSDRARGAGTVLLAWTLRRAFEDGLREYRFLRGSEAYKYRWASEDPALLTLAAPLTRSGRLAAGLACRGERASRARRIAPPRLAGRLTRRLLLGA